VKRYFVEVPAARAAELEACLWETDRVASSELPVVLEQYKLYVEMADRVASRRSLANTFFLTLNTLVFTGIGVLWQDPPQASAWLGLFPLVVLVLQCAVWFWTIRSYRQLSAAKWPLTRVEQWVPWLFALAYIGGFVVLLTAGP
jgi:hypothetical protein